LVKNLAFLDKNLPTKRFSENCRSEKNFGWQIAPSYYDAINADSWTYNAGMVDKLGEVAIATIHTVYTIYSLQAERQRDRHNIVSQNIYTHQRHLVFATGCICGRSHKCQM